MADDHKIAPDNDKIHPAAKFLMWTVSPKIVKNFIWFSVAGLVVFFLLQFVYPFTDPSHMAPWDHLPGAWAIIGFVAYTIVVLSAGPLFKLLARDEDYYGEGGTDG